MFLISKLNIIGCMILFEFDLAQVEKFYFIWSTAFL